MSQVKHENQWEKLIKKDNKLEVAFINPYEQHSFVVNYLNANNHIMDKCIIKLSNLDKKTFTIKDKEI